MANYWVIIARSLIGDVLSLLLAILFLDVSSVQQLLIDPMTFPYSGARRRKRRNSRDREATDRKGTLLDWHKNLRKGSRLTSELSTAETFQSRKSDNLSRNFGISPSISETMSFQSNPSTTQLLKNPGDLNPNKYLKEPVISNSKYMDVAFTGVSNASGKTTRSSGNNSSTQGEKSMDRENIMLKSVYRQNTDNQNPQKSNNLRRRASLNSVSVNRVSLQERQLNQSVTSRRLSFSHSDINQMKKPGSGVTVTKLPRSKSKIRPVT